MPSKTFSNYEKIFLELLSMSISSLSTAGILMPAKYGLRHSGRAAGLRSGPMDASAKKQKAVPRYNRWKLTRFSSHLEKFIHLWYDKQDFRQSFNVREEILWRTRLSCARTAPAI